MDGQPGGRQAFFRQLVDTRTMSTVFGADDTLYVDTPVTDATGALAQTVEFVVGAGVEAFTGILDWEVSAAAGLGPRLVGVDVDVLDALDNVVYSDTFAGVLGGFAHSTFDGSLAPGSYRLVATSNGIRDASLNIALNFTGQAVVAVPLPATPALLLGGLLAVGVLRAGRVARPRS